MCLSGGYGHGVLEKLTLAEWKYDHYNMLTS